MLVRPHPPEPLSTAVTWPVGRTGFYAASCLFTVLLLVCIGLQPLRSGGSAAAGDGDLFRQVSYLVLFALTMVVTRRGNWLAIVPVSLVLVFGWCWLSLIWALEPAIALRWLVITKAIVVLVFAAVHRAGARRALRALWWALVAVLCLNYLAVLLSPVAVHGTGETGDLALAGSWRGGTMHKNFAGPISAITVLVLLLDRRRINLALRWGLVAAAAYFLWRTQSKTALALLPAALGCALVYMALGPRQRVWLPAVLMFLIFLSVPLWLWMGEELGRYLARPEAFTGRGQVWGLLLEYAAANPLFGAGFGSFWGVGGKGPVGEWGESWVAGIYSGHNGYLDLLVQLGWPGLLLAAGGWLALPLWRVLSGRKIPRRDGGLAVALLVFAVGHNLTESSLLNRDHPVWVLLVVAVALVCQLARERRPRSLPQSSHVDERVLNDRPGGAAVNAFAPGG